jgi:hypothetical protein
VASAPITFGCQILVRHLARKAHPALYTKLLSQHCHC